MLEEAIEALKGGDLGVAGDQWSPTIALGTAVLIPESYVTDLQLRLGLYRRLSSLETRADIDAFASELVDRFGQLPDEVTALLDVMEIKGLCRLAGVQQLDAGPKGATITFRKGLFANPEGLVLYIARNRSTVKLQPDQKLLFRGEWEKPEARLKGVREVVTMLSDIAQAPKKVA